MSFPAPHKLGEACTRWRLSDLLAFEAAKDDSRPEPPESLDPAKDDSRPGPPEPLDPAKDIYLSVRQVADRYGISRNTVWRWVREGAK